MLYTEVIYAIDLCYKIYSMALQVLESVVRHFINGYLNK